MNVGEFVGFFIMLIALIFSVARRIMQARNEAKNPGAAKRAEEEQERLIREILGVQEDVVPNPPPPPKKTAKPPPPPPPATGAYTPERKLRRDYVFESSFDHQNKVERDVSTLESSVESRHLKSSLGEHLKKNYLEEPEHPKMRGVRPRPRLHEWVIAKEVLGAPKAFH